MNYSYCELFTKKIYLKKLISPIVIIYFYYVNYYFTKIDLLKTVTTPNSNYMFLLSELLFHTKHLLKKIPLPIVMTCFYYVN